MTTTASVTAAARINGVPLHEGDAVLPPEELRQRACTELLRQAAQRAGLLAAGDRASSDGAISEEAVDAIEALLDQSLALPAPTEEACRRHFAAHAAEFQAGERVRLRHILFAVTPGVDVVALRKRAEASLLDVRCHDGKSGERFADAARASSNCPSGADGGELGMLCAADCAPEFAREIFGRAEVGVLPRLVHSRFGLHVVEVQAREPGVAQPFAAVRGAVAMALHQQAYVTALRQYLALLAGEARVEGVDRRRNHAAGPVMAAPELAIAGFDDLLRAARQQSEPQRLLFVFAAAELPDDCTPEQRRHFAEGRGGTLAPLMCVDKRADELTSFATLAEEAAAAGPAWAIVFVAGLAGRGGCAPSSEEAAAPLQRMVDAIKAGSHGAFIPFDRSGQAVQFE